MLLKNTSLRVLDLSRNVITDEDFSHLLKALPVHFCLQKLDVSHTWISDRSIESLITLLKSDSKIALTELYLHDTWVTETKAREFALKGWLNQPPVQIYCVNPTTLSYASAVLAELSQRSASLQLPDELWPIIVDAICLVPGGHATVRGLVWELNGGLFY